MAKAEAAQREKVAKAEAKAEAADRAKTAAAAEATRKRAEALATPLRSLLAHGQIYQMPNTLTDPVKAHLVMLDDVIAGRVSPDSINAIVARQMKMDERLLSTLLTACATRVARG